MENIDTAGRETTAVIHNSSSKLINLNSENSSAKKNGGRRMNNYIFVNAPKSKGELNGFIKKLEEAVTSSIKRQLKDEAIAQSTYTHTHQVSSCPDRSAV